MQREAGMPYRSVRQRRRTHDADRKEDQAPAIKRRSKKEHRNGETSSRDDAGSLRKKGIQ